MAPPQLKIIDDAYELALYLAGRVGKMPRQHRYDLGLDITRASRAVLLGLVAARYAVDKAGHLRDVNTRLEELRWLLRLALDLDAITPVSHGHAIKQIQHVGAQVGGWLRSLPVGRPTN